MREYFRVISFRIFVHLLLYLMPNPNTDLNNGVFDVLKNSRRQLRFAVTFSVNKGKYY